MTIFLLSLLLLCGARDVFAHATPTLYEPAASAAVDRIPASVRIQFSERIEPDASSITVFAPDGSRADTNHGAPDPSNPRIFTVGLRDAGAGTYTVSWQVVSRDDGHLTKGGYAFSVGKPVDPSQANTTLLEVIHSSTTSQAAAIGAELVGQSMFLGVLATIALLWKVLPQRRIPDLQQSKFESASSSAVAFAALLMTFGISSFLILKTVDLQQSRSATFAEAFLTFLSTVDGRFAVYRGVLAVLFVAIFSKARNSIFKRDRTWNGVAVLFILVALMILLRARVSHAAASVFLPNFSILVNALHLLAKEFWIGCLIALTVVLMPY
jgi:copper transport protein